LATGTWPEAIEMPGKAMTVSIKCKKTLGVRGSAPDLAGGAYSAPPDPLAGGEGAGCPLPKNPSPDLGPSGLGLRPFGPRLSSPPNFKPPLS